ncbi:cold shock domain-containing protein [Desulfogranum marinum]|uniref:cold shock domain-containing protein n=1 Tax=Desulfogranum marinum TaxID=453220 RepID=UPI001962CF43|nr:cold shock domain-containing protein [Desulfogranum marinum]MBM9515197.1 cold shock domain-containing protein [Desulfogranum marinum]
MASIRLKGTLKKWFDDKGFGFIAQEKDTQDIFIHVSAFDRNIPRRPTVGDTIFYHVQTDNKGKVKAFDAVIEGAAPVTKKPVSRPKNYNKSRRSEGSWKLFVICAVLVIGGGSTIYSRIQSGAPLLPSTSITSNILGTSKITKKPSRYTCSGKTHCSQMTSCEEATFYQRNCPGTKMDGDGDGIPCVRQLCN